MVERTSLSIAPLSGSLSVALAQINPKVGDVAGNLALARRFRADAAALGADLVVFPELSVCGYPPEDLVLRAGFLSLVREAVDALAAQTADGGPALLIGAPWKDANGNRVNAALLLDGGEIRGEVHKHHLPNYGVFDEVRVFTPGALPEPMDVRGHRLGVMICEDMWWPDVTAHLAARGATALISMNGSPYELGKRVVREGHARARVAESGLPLVYVNQIGGQDDLVFDGASFVMDGAGAVVQRLAPWAEDCALLGAASTAPDKADELEDIWQAMVTGLRDYVTKNGFPGVILGLSGGIDSAISAIVAVDALGVDRVHCVMMPGPYTAQISLDDAAELAANLGVRLDTVPITQAMTAFDGMLAPLFEGRAPDVTEENIQSRIRGVVLMALSNKFGSMVLTTGNKSEMSVGYATLYGDMNGGYSVIKDIYKTTVFALSRWRNAHRPAGALGPDGAVMPERIITRPPSAELRPDQRDDDSLPPYDALDAILRTLVEDRLSIAETVRATNQDEATVARVWNLLRIAEYKRRQAPPGVKITPLSFSRERRYPITSGYRALDHLPKEPAE